jgi:DNA-binding beta-propeller fold protein YncE
MTSSTDPVPFAFVVDVRGRVVLADASGSANTYRALPQVRSAQAARRPPMARPQHAWLAAAGDYFYATNTASDTITGIRRNKGQLDLLHAVGISATTDAGRIDIAVAPDGR